MKVHCGRDLAGAAGEDQEGPEGNTLNNITQSPEAKNEFPKSPLQYKEAYSSSPSESAGVDN